MNDDEATPKKKGDKPADIVTSDSKKDKSDTEEPKPRIVLTFRSEKSNTKSANMKIVSSEEKHEEVSPRRSSRTRGKWDWVCDSDTSVSPKKDKSQPTSENDESDSSHTAPKRTRRRSRDDNILASAIARKEKSYNEATPGPTRLSRRIKPTAKILANEELRIGLESQNNARLGIQTEKSPEDGVRTRRSARPVEVEKPKVAKSVVVEPDVVELDSDSQNSDMKLQHLCKLGLKAIDPEEVDVEPEEDDESKELDEDDEAELLEDEEEIDDDSEVISKLLEADEDTEHEDDDDFLCTVAASKGRPRRSTRLCSSFGMNDSGNSSPVQDDDSKAPPRRSSRRAGVDDSDRSHRTRRKRRHSDEDDAALEAECDDGSDPAGGDEGSEAACPTEKSTVVAKCYCDTPSNIYADPAELIEPVFCQAVETVEGVRVGCSHGARRAEGVFGALVRAGPRAPFALVCSLHAQQLARHMCCPACGLYCSQGIFFQCSEGHLFHVECGLPYSDSKCKPGCPHCGVFSYRWQPANTDTWKVRVDMKTTNKRIFLPDQREQCTPAYLGFSTLSASQLSSAPMIPEDLLPPAKELKRLCAENTDVVKCTPQELCDAILAGESLELLIPKILSGCKLNKRLSSQHGGSVCHAAALAGAAGALHALRAAGADLDLADNNMRTPLMVALLALLDKSELKPKKKKPEKNSDDMEVESKEDLESQEEASQESSKAEENRAKDEDLLRVIRYLIAAGADVNLPDQPDSMSPLHVAAQHGAGEAVAALLAAPTIQVDARDHGGWSPLVWAAENNHPHVVKLLLEAGASASSVDKEGNSAVHWCALAGASACLQLVLQHAPRAADLPNKHTDTPLHIAARQGHYACVVILLARGAKSDVENSAGELPADVCAGASHAALALDLHMRRALRDAPATRRLLVSDISNGREQVPVPCVNEVDSEPAPSDFTYVTQHVTPHAVSVDTTIQSLQGCSCAEGACGAEGAACACVALGVRAWWRAARLAAGFPYRDPPMLFQCNPTCRCNPKLCGNSVVSRLTSQGSLFVRAEVYRVGDGRGWGLRACAPVLRGAPVATYCGELLPLQQADTRPDDSYMFALDVKADLLEQCGDTSTLCVDACRYGGAARFVNHSCAPNLAPVRVFTATRDLRLPTVTLFATRDILAGEQLTFDYGDKFWSVKSKWMRCECGAPDCRYPTKSADETES